MVRICGQLELVWSKGFLMDTLQFDLGHTIMQANVAPKTDIQGYMYFRTSTQYFILPCYLSFFTTNSKYPI